MNQKDERQALFWCNLLHPIIYDEIDNNNINSYLTSLSKKEVLFPNGECKKPCLSTLKRKLTLFQDGWFRNLARKIRSDRGQIRSVLQEIADKAIAIKKEQPKRSHDTINHFLKTEYNITIPKSTLYDIFKQAGATRMKLGVTKQKVRKRWTRDHTHDLWVGDFADGPYVIVDSEVVPTYLCVWIDCHSRYVIDARYYLRQNLDILIDSLLRSWAIHGKSNELYVDNAKIYWANALQAVCYELGIKLLHRPPRDPPAGGLVEKIVQITQDQFESEVRAGDILTFDALNRGLAAFFEMVYHPRGHSETGQPPKDRYQQGLTAIRHVDMDEVIKFFMNEENRTVHKDFSDIQLDNRYYKVNKRLRGDRVKVKYDPFSDMTKVLIYSFKNEYLGEGVLHTREQGDDTVDVSKRPNPAHNFIELITQEHEKQINAHSKGIDFRKVLAARSWPFIDFIKKFAALMGRKGGLGEFNADDLEMLKKNYDRFPKLNEPMLVEAWVNAEHKTISYVIYELQRINKIKENK